MSDKTIDTLLRIMVVAVVCLWLWKIVEVLS